MNQNTISYTPAASFCRNDFNIIPSVKNRDYGTSLNRRSPLPVLFIFLMATFAFSTQAAENNVPQDDDASTRVGDHSFKVIDLTWDDFSFQMPIPVDETYNIIREEDFEDGENFDILISRNDNAYLFYGLSTRSLTKDDGKSYKVMKFFLLFSEGHDHIEERISQALKAGGFIPVEYKRVEKVCDLDNALIFQAEVLCDYRQYTRNLLVAIGIMKHNSYSYRTISINFLADKLDEWDNYFAWNKFLAELQ